MGTDTVKCWAACLVWLCIATFPQLARANQMVTACASDTAAGGLNLATALAAGGAISFNCGEGPTTLRITRTHMLHHPVTLDGGGRVTLLGNGLQPMFRTDRDLRLNNLSLRNADVEPVGGMRPPGIVDGNGRIKLSSVHTSRTVSAFSAASFDATDSTFEHNGLQVAASYGATIQAERITLQRTVFRENYEQLLGGTPSSQSPRVTLARAILIENGTFTRNRFGLLAIDGTKLQIRASRFEGNGEPAGDTNQNWGCCAGAITLVHSSAEIGDTEFISNHSAGAGGAIQAIGSQLRIARSLFSNNTARLGGAVMSWALPIAAGTWNEGPPVANELGLRLDHVRFRENRAESVGGAIVWAGPMNGDSALFLENQAIQGGALAHWSTMAPSNSPPGHAVAGLVSMTSASGLETAALTRVILLRNRAQQGAAVDSGNARLQLGNSLVAGHPANPQHADSAALHGRREIALFNTTIVDNLGVGLKLAAPDGQLILANTLIADNERGNCLFDAARIHATAPNLQYPGSDCGSAITSQPPRLDARYAPEWTSPARGAGSHAVCIGAPLVGGQDLYGGSRTADTSCAIGAVEPERLRDVIDEVVHSAPWIPSGPDRNRAYLCWLILVIVAFLLGLFIVFFLRCKRRKGGELNTL